MKFGETRDYVAKGNAHLFKEFKESVIWHDMRAELDVWLTEIRDVLENPNTPDVVTHSLRGSAEAIRNVLVLPETLADNISADKKAEEDKEKHDGRD